MPIELEKKIKKKVNHSPSEDYGARCFEFGRYDFENGRISGVMDKTDECFGKKKQPGFKARRKATRKKFVVPTGGRVGSKKTKLIDYVNQSAKGFTTTGDVPIPSFAEVKDTKLFSIFLYVAVPCCLSILCHKIQTSSS